MLDKRYKATHLINRAAHAIFGNHTRCDLLRLSTTFKPIISLTEDFPKDKTWKNMYYTLL